MPTNEIKKTFFLPTESLIGATKSPPQTKPENITMQKATNINLFAQIRSNSETQLFMRFLLAIFSPLKFGLLQKFAGTHTFSSVTKNSYPFGNFSQQLKSGTKRKQGRAWNIRDAKSMHSIIMLATFCQKLPLPPASSIISSYDPGLPNC